MSHFHQSARSLRLLARMVILLPLAATPAACAMAADYGQTLGQATSPVVLLPPPTASAAQPSEGSPPPQPAEKKEGEKSDEEQKKDGETTASPQCWNFHAQTTVTAQGDPAFAAKYSGPNSLSNAGERQETLAADLFAGARLWQGAEIHLDALMWQGFGLSDTFGV